MHVPEKWQMPDKAHIHRFIEHYSFANLITPDLNSSMVPLLLKTDEGQLGTLYGHLARSNKHTNTINNTPVLVMFNGPHSYISPNWYANKPAVPTWNYAHVQAKGVVELVDNQTTLAILRQTIAKYEPELTTNTDLMPPQYIEKLNKAIVGFKISITDLQGKEKLGQHRSEADQQGVAQGLSESQHPDAKQLLTYMQTVALGLEPA
jgi:transcriptional regulator